MANFLDHTISYNPHNFSVQDNLIHHNIGFFEKLKTWIAVNTSIIVVVFTAIIYRRRVWGLLLTFSIFTLNYPV